MFQKFAYTFASFVVQSLCSSTGKSGTKRPGFVDARSQSMAHSVVYVTLAHVAHVRQSWKCNQASQIFALCRLLQLVGDAIEILYCLENCIVERLGASRVSVASVPLKEGLTRRRLKGGTVVNSYLRSAKGAKTELKQEVQNTTVNTQVECKLTLVSCPFLSPIFPSLSLLR